MFCCCVVYIGERTCVCLSPCFLHDFNHTWTSSEPLHPVWNYGQPHLSRGSALFKTQCTLFMECDQCTCSLGTFCCCLQAVMILPLPNCKLRLTWEGVAGREGTCSLSVNPQPASVYRLLRRLQCPAPSQPSECPSCPMGAEQSSSLSLSPDFLVNLVAFCSQLPGSH